MTANHPKKRRWIILLEVALVAAAALVLLWTLFLRPAQGAGGTAHIYVNGDEVITLDLSQTGDQMMSLQEIYGVPVSFQVEDHRIRFVNVDCPDHLCERAGYVGADGQTAVCMPNRTAVVITE